MKRWNPKKDPRKEGQEANERPTCPLTPNNTRCLQNCIALIKCDDGTHGCVLRDALESIVKVFSGAMPSIGAQSEPRGRGRPRKGTGEAYDGE